MSARPELHRHLEEKRALEQMLSIVDRTRLHGASGLIFNQLFPPNMKHGIFNPDSIIQHGDIEYSKSEKEIADKSLDYLGYMSTKGIVASKSHQTLDMFRVGFSSKPGDYFIHDVNNLPFVLNLQGIGQTHSESMVSRAQHSMHLANIVARDLIRMAIKTPELFIERVETDMDRMGVSRATLLKKPAFQQNDLQEVPPKSLKALNYALGYSQYLTLYAYMHDEMTPALGDTVMKASARFDDQSEIKYSEDASLRENIRLKMYRPDTKLLKLMKTYDMDPELMITITERLSSEGDTTLGALLMKNKRKFDETDTSFPPELKVLYRKAALDRDQESGTVANMYDVANMVMPGGFEFTYKPGKESLKLRLSGKEAKTGPPIGSFEDRMMLLAYSLATGTDLRQELRRKGMTDPLIDRIYIAAEEFTIGPNFKLMKVPELGGEILPVALNPGDVKRLLLAFNTLTYFHYQSDSLSGTERILQDIITTINVKEDVIKWFDNRSNYEIFEQLSRYVSPVFSYIDTLFKGKMMRLTKEEFEREYEIYKGYMLYSEAKVFGPDMKPGTLVKSAEGAITTHLDLLDRSYDTDLRTERERSTPSLPSRLKNVGRVLEEEREQRGFYHCIVLSPEEITLLRQSIVNSRDEYESDIITALSHWGFEELV